MAASLTASFILKLEDRLSSGIAALSKRLEALAALSAKLKFEGLQQAGGALDKVGVAADKVSRKVEGIGRSARSAIGELRRLSSQPIMVNTSGTAFLPPSMGRAAMAAAVAGAVAAGAAGGGGRVPALPSASFFSTPNLQLAGPGGGIPLNFNPALMQMSSLVGLAGQFRTALGQAAAQARNVGQQLGHAGHAALGAAATGFGLYHLVHSAAETDSTLRQAAIAQGLSGPAATADVARMMRLVSGDATRTGQSVPGLAEAYGDLVARGLPPSLVDELIRTHSTAATAYHINPVDLGQTVYSLNKTLGIGHEEMGGAIAALAQSTHAGSFKMGDFARYLPLVAGQMKQLGWTGRGSLDSVASMIEMVSHQSGTPQEAATDFKAMLDAITAKYTVKSFKHEGIDLPARMKAATKAGQNPVDAYLDILEGLIKGISDPVEQAYKLGNVLHNREAGATAKAILQQRREQRELAERLHAVGGDKLQRDFGTAMEGLLPQLNRLSAEWQVFEMRLGMGFAHLVGPAIDALHGLNAALAWLDEHLPGLTDTVLTWGGGLAVVSTALGVLIPLFRAVGAGFSLLLGLARLLVTGITLLARAFVMFVVEGGPVIWIIAAIAAAAFLIYRNWDTLGPYFRQFWADIKVIFSAFWNWLSGWAGPTATAIVDAIKAAWSGLTGFFAKLWADVQAPFDAFMTGVENRLGAIRRLLGGGTPDTAPVGPEPDGKAPLGGVPGLRQQLDQNPFAASPMSYRPSGGGQFGFAPLEVKVTVDGPAKVEAPRQLQPVNRGPTLDRA